MLFFFLPRDHFNVHKNILTLINTVQLYFCGSKDKITRGCYKKGTACFWFQSKLYCFELKIVILCKTSGLLLLFNLSEFHVEPPILALHLMEFVHASPSKEQNECYYYLESKKSTLHCCRAWLEKQLSTEKVFNHSHLAWLKLVLDEFQVHSLKAMAKISYFTAFTLNPY